MYVKSPLRTAASLLFLKAPLEAQLIVTRRCNLSCGYCTEYDDYSPPVPFETLKERIDALHRLRVVNISILGGEPLMHPQIGEIVEYGNTKAQVSITTNGFLLNEKIVERLNQAKLGNMEISIDTIEKDRTGYIQKSLKTLAPKLTMLKKIAKFDVHINLVLCERTKDLFKETIEEFSKFGFFLGLDLLHEPDGRVAIQGKEYLDLWEHYYKSGIPFSYMDYSYGKQLLEGKRPKWKCRAGSRVLYVDEFGKVQYCSSQRGKLNIPVTEYTFKDLRREHKKFKGCEDGCGLLCVYRDSMLDNAPLTTVKGLVKAFRKGVVLKSPAPPQQAATAPAPAT
jgi:MoaA/NifB/PqqE/SkfB family radical SAM enzyme